MDNNEKQLKELVDELLASKSITGNIKVKIAKFYRLGMDSAAIEKNGIAVLNDELKKIDEIQNKKDVEKEISHLHQYGITPGFQLYGAADHRNSSMMITQLHQGGLGLPDKDYYLSDNDRFKKIRKKYIEHISRIFELAGDKVGEAKINAYYNPTQNEIVFPAGILQPPFFYFDADGAVNYGAIGVVITHGFDDQGRLYDKDGNLNTWWTDEDSKLFKERTQVLVNQFVVLDTIRANGEYTLGENIADLGGINVAYTAFLKTNQGK